MRLLLALAAWTLLLADLATASVAVALVERTNAPVKKLTVTKIVQILKAYDKKGEWCSSYLKWTKSATKITTKEVTSTRTVTRTKLATFTDAGCTTTEPYVYDTTTLFIGPVTTITELQVTSTAVSLIFGGPIGKAEGEKVKRGVRYPAPQLSGQPCASLSKACSKLVRKPGTTTKTRTRVVAVVTSRTTRTVTATECGVTDYDFVLSTETAPSSTVEAEGFRTVTVATVTEAVEYFCWPSGLGCVLAVPTPCCDVVTNGGVEETVYPVCEPVARSVGVCGGNRG
ncbi:hypothetical protein DRE_03031 [Drechslerella stenobrocha 248]|uniref:Uncharacterized protein n=1 Tax=Drechslerella stenobrocha 248 TaxID=1043628 RepID=W7HUE6_9PEZI|nr:hypothetical protein DRE_03031 [Drechslerella stenobrocha 248]